MMTVWRGWLPWVHAAGCPCQYCSCPGVCVLRRSRSRQGGVVDLDSLSERPMDSRAESA